MLLCGVTKGLTHKMCVCVCVCVVTDTSRKVEHANKDLSSQTVKNIRCYAPDKN